MPKIEDDIGIEKLLVTNHNVDKINASDTDIVISGTYPQDVTKIYISIDNEPYIEVGVSAAARTLGTPSVTFANGSFTIRYPVPNPQLSRIISFKIRGGNSEGRQGEIQDYKVAYNKPSTGHPGFAIVSTGGLAFRSCYPLPNCPAPLPGDIDAGMMVTSVGQSVSPYRSPASANGVVVDSSSIKLHYGIIGVLLSQ